MLRQRGKRTLIVSLIRAILVAQRTFVASWAMFAGRDFQLMRVIGYAATPLADRDEVQAELDDGTGSSRFIQASIRGRR
jgi:hypothetical protein